MANWFVPRSTISSSMPTAFALVYAFAALGCMMLAAAAEAENSTSSVLLGHWHASTNVTRDCLEQYRCTGSNFTFSFAEPDGSAFAYSTETACDELLKVGVRDMAVHGDSYGRHIYQALGLLLSGNFYNGSSAMPQCYLHKQFSVDRCRIHEVKPAMFVCRDQILLHLHTRDFLDPGPCSQSGGLVLLTEGAHSPGYPGKGRVGVHNASAFIHHYLNTFCPKLKAIPTANRFLSSTSSREQGTPWFNSTQRLPPCSMYWVSRHYRMRAGALDERDEVLRAFNEGMDSFFRQNASACPGVRYVDTYAMTAELASHHEVDAKQLTYDSNHWGMEINLVKAQLIVRAITKMA